jgi:hypothetical protein
VPAGLAGLDGRSRLNRERYAARHRKFAIVPCPIAELVITRGIAIE